MATTNRLSTEVTIRVPRNHNGTLPDRLTRAIAVLKEAADYAERTGAATWDFAVEVAQLRDLGLSNSDLRYLVKLNFVEHAAEATTANSQARRFRNEAELSITNKSCFVLSREGRHADLTKGILRIVRLSLRPDAGSQRGKDVSQVPTWDFARRLLAFNDQVVKQFKRKAVNQELILSAFQEEGWPTRIDDPLTPQPTIDEKRRLADAIKSLNRNQLTNHIRFHGDGSGQAIIWEKLLQIALVVAYLQPFSAL